MADATKILDKITRYSIWALVFLIPLFFLPFGPGVLDFQKQVLLVLLTMIGLGAFILKTLMAQEIEFKRSFLGTAVLIFILMLGASTAFSWNSAQSFFGPIGVPSSGLLTWVCLAAFFFLVINSFDSIVEVYRLMWIGLYSALMVVLFGFLQAWNIFLLPWEFAKAQGFNTVGGFNSLALFAAAVVPLVIALYLAAKKAFYKAVLALLGLLSFSLLMIANYWVLWTCLGVGTAVLIVLLKIDSARVKDKWIILPLLILVIAFSLALIQPDLPGLPNPSAGISLTYNSAFEMAKKVINGDQGSIRAALGTGPGTFTFLYDLLKPRGITESVWWAVTLQRASSQMLGLLATTGILGALAMLGVIVSFGVTSIKKIIGQQRGKFTPTRALKIGLVSGWLVLVTGKFLYPAVLSVQFLFWLFMALFVTITLFNKQKHE